MAAMALFLIPGAASADEINIQTEEVVVEEVAVVVATGTPVELTEGLVSSFKGYVEEGAIEGVGVDRLEKTLGDIERAILKYDELQNTDEGFFLSFRRSVIRAMALHELSAFAEEKVLFYWDRGRVSDEAALDLILQAETIIDSIKK